MFRRSFLFVSLLRCVSFVVSVTLVVLGFELVQSCLSSRFVPVLPTLVTAIVVGLSF